MKHCIVEAVHQVIFGSLYGYTINVAQENATSIPRIDADHTSADPLYVVYTSSQDQFICNDDFWLALSISGTIFVHQGVVSRVYHDNIL